MVERKVLFLLFVAVFGFFFNGHKEREKKQDALAKKCPQE